MGPRPRPSARLPVWSATETIRSTDYFYPEGVGMATEFVQSIDLTGKTVFVAGGTSGINLGIAEDLSLIHI